MLTRLRPGEEKVLQERYALVKSVSKDKLGLDFPEIETFILPQLPKHQRNDQYVTGERTFLYVQDGESYPYATFREGLYVIPRLNHLVAHSSGHAYQFLNNRRLKANRDGKPDNANLLREGWATRVEELLARYMGFPERIIISTVLNPSSPLRYGDDYVKGRGVFQEIGKRYGWDAEVAATLECRDDAEFLSRL